MVCFACEMFEHLKGLECSWEDQEDFLFIYVGYLVSFVPVGLYKSNKDFKVKLLLSKIKKNVGCYRKHILTVFLYSKVILENASPDCQPKKPRL